MQGRPAKQPEHRRNNHAPTRGEWVDLQPLTEPVLPAYPMPWYKASARHFVVPKWMWDLWREDSVTSQWSPGDVAQALELGQDFYRLKPEHRLRIQTALGLNSTGRRNLRWRNAVETDSAEKATQHAADVRRLRIVQEKQGGD